MGRCTRLIFKGLMLVSLLFCLAPFAKAQGSCPTGSNYIDLTNPSNGNGYGSVVLSSSNAGGITQCWYFSSSGSDSNSCTTEGSPCQHLPGMPGCSGTCANIKPAPGQGFIIEGGSSYHRNSGTPSFGGNWVWPSGNGTSGNYIYLGIDPTWYSGASFARPIFTADNTPQNATVSSCSYSGDGTNLLNFGTNSPQYLIVDGLDLQGECTASGALSYVYTGANDHQVFERFYIHGWSYATGYSDDCLTGFSEESGRCFNTYTSGKTNRFLFDIVDGSDSTYGQNCTNTSCIQAGAVGGGTFVTNGATGFAFSTGADVEYSVIRHVSNGIQANYVCTLVSNWFDHVMEPSGVSRHGNVIETNAFDPSNPCTTLLAYGNVTGNTNEGINWELAGENDYIFDNAWFNSGHYAPDPNGLMLSAWCPNTACNPLGTGPTVTAYLWNNTFQYNTAKVMGSNSSWGGVPSGSSFTLENIHLMDVPMSGFLSCQINSGTCTITDNGGDVANQTTGSAESQGFSFDNRWSPQNSSASTVHAGNNMSSFCSTIPASAQAACAYGSGGAVNETSAWGGEFAYYPYTAPNSRGTTWDAGAYQFSGSGTSNAPAPPTGLTAVVQ